MLVIKLYAVFSISWFIGLLIYLVFRRWLNSIWHLAKSISATASRKVAYDLAIVSISAGGFGVLSGINGQSTHDEIVARLIVSFVFIALGLIIIFKNLTDH